MRLFAELPANMTYPQLQPKMALYAENVGKWKEGENPMIYPAFQIDSRIQDAAAHAMEKNCPPS